MTTHLISNGRVFSLLSALTLATALLVGAVSAQDKPADKKDKPNAAGTWKWSQTGQGGQTFETTAKLKQDGEKLTGSATGRGGTDSTIEDGTIKNEEVTFKIVRERNGQKVTAKYKGKIQGDTIKGTVETERDGQTRSREWEAKRSKE